MERPDNTVPCTKAIDITRMIDMNVSSNFMYYTNLFEFYCTYMFVKNHCLLDFFVNVPSIYPFLPPVIMYIDEI